MEFEFEGKRPQVHPDAYIAPTAVLIGEVEIGAGASVWFGAVLRGDEAAIKVGDGAKISANTLVISNIPAGATVMGAMLSSRFSVTWPIARSPARSPMAIAATSTTMPSAMTVVANRFDGSCIGRLYMLQRLRRDVTCRSSCLAVGGLAQQVKLAQLARGERRALCKTAKLNRNVPRLIDQVARENAHGAFIVLKSDRGDFNRRRGNLVAHIAPGV